MCVSALNFARVCLQLRVLFALTHHVIVLNVAVGCLKVSINHVVQDDCEEVSGLGQATHVGYFQLFQEHNRVRPVHLSL